ncbi:M56 family metallopeptidase [Prosthecobacter dejongeii]|uniref:Beta-lactamase regulating signal transducer with metallopeptidase domain n=1 Tax=Prosthecobacter dejongeii TaxID=48465 RepID=A0A7W7YHE4_9BACT|nr:M56 family metallopeptidase [Prosthecobacter dejongeii]MBB5036072.1 beta-lactamase regulating signal transducer with metallopeptidase domain [Prosthecobacter dejongeii]
MNLLPQLFDWVLATSLRASLLAAAVLLIQAALHRHLTPRWRYALWLPVLATLLMPSLLESRWSVETLLSHTAKEAVVAPAAQPLPMALEIAAPAVPIPPTPTQPFNWQLALATTWAVGCCAWLLCGTVSFMLALRRYRRSALPAPTDLLHEIEQVAAEMRLRRLPRIWVSPQVGSPAITGVWRPTLMLPFQLGEHFTPAEIRLILKHELMHLKRGDLPMNLLLCALMALHWFNPLLWMAFFKVRTDREAACDAQVLAHGSTESRRHYGHALLKMESAFGPHGLSLGFVGIFQRGTALRTRIQAIAQAPRSHPLMRSFIVGAMAVLTFLGSTRAQTPPDEAAQKDLSFALGQSRFRPGDALHIISVERTAEFLTVTGKYELTSQDAATLGLYITSLDSPAKGVPNGPNQQVVLQKGRGKFSLTLPQPYPGLPHLTFYKLAPPSNHKAFGAIYFGTKAEAEASHKLNLSYLAQDAPYPTVANKYLLEKLDRIVLPDIQFSGATLEEVVEFLTVKAKEYDTTETDETRKGVPFLILLRPGPQKIISLDLKKVPLVEAIRYVSELAGMKFRVEPHAVIFVPATGSTPLIKATPTPAQNPKGRAGELDRKIILPQVQLKEATLEEAAEYLRTQVQTACDRMQESPLNIIIKPGAPAGLKISLSLKEVPLVEALRYLAELSNHTLRADDQGFILEPR